jgi:hypothetical protein
MGETPDELGGLVLRGRGVSRASGRLPHRENRFPGDEGFDKDFEQPLMQPGASMGRVERDFWASTDPQSSLFKWKFPDSPHTQAFLSETIYERTEPVTYVSHDADDGAWQFLGDSMDDGGGPVLVCLHHPIDDDPSLSELADLPLGWYAKRNKPGEPWTRRQKEPEDSAEGRGMALPEPSEQN